MTIEFLREITDWVLKSFRAILKKDSTRACVTRVDSEFKRAIEHWRGQNWGVT